MDNPERRITLASAALCLFAACLPAETQDEKANRPNVVFILSDDQGWGDYSFMGHPHIKTPNIDTLGAAGMLYERGYVTAPLCRPSLASLATGLYPHQTGIRGNDPVGWRKLKRNKKIGDRACALRKRMSAPMATHLSFIKILQAHGYTTLQTGKWWEGNALDHGFDRAMTHGDPRKGGRHGDQGLKIGRETMQPIFDFVDKAVVDKEPFFIWYAPFLPHSPHNAPRRLFEKYKPLAPNEPTAWYWANCEWLDETCGQLVDFLKEKGQYGNTIFVYTCDNGWRQHPERRNRYDKRSKREPYEMGIRTPIFITCPARLSPMRDKTTPASNIDIAPTILRACGIEVPGAMSGLDLRDTEALEERNRIFVDVYEHDSDLDRLDDIDHGLEARVVIDGWDKLIYRPTGSELFHLENDVDDQNDLSAEYPGKLNKLKDLLRKWLEETR